MTLLLRFFYAALGLHSPVRRRRRWPATADRRRRCCRRPVSRDRSLRLSVCLCPLDYIQFHTISKREDLQIGGIGGVLWIDSCDGQDTVSLHLPMIDRCKWFRAHGLTVSFWTLRLCQSPWSNNCGDKDSSNVDQYRLSVTNKEGVRTDW